MRFQNRIKKIRRRKYFRKSVQTLGVFAGIGITAHVVMALSFDQQRDPNLIFAELDQIKEQEEKASEILEQYHESMSDILFQLDEVTKKYECDMSNIGMMDTPKDQCSDSKM